MTKRTMSKKESYLQKKVLKKLKTEVGGFWTNIHGGPFQRKGLPDIIGTVEGYFIAIELKVGNNEPTEIQEETLRRIKEEGKAFAFWSTDADRVIRRVKKYIERRKKAESRKHGKRNRA